MLHGTRCGVPVPPNYPEAVVFRLMPEIEIEETSPSMSTEVIIFLGFLN